MESKLFVPKKGISIDYGESKIYTFNGSIYKEFKDNISQATRRRKKEKLKYLQQFEYLKHYYPEIEYFVECLFGLYIKGYVMKEIETKSINSYSIPTEKRLILLKQIRKILKMFNDIGLRYYDIHLDNIRCTKSNRPIFFDIDSILFSDDKKPDIKPYGFDYYECLGGNLDSNFQRLKFNVFIKEALSSCQELNFDEIGQEMMNYQLNKYSPHSIFAHEDLLEHVLIKK